MKNYLKIVSINEHSLTPLYKQLACSIVEGIDSGKIVKDDILPSIRDFCLALDISKKTVEMAYNLLKAQGLVGSVKGKGYFVVTESVV